MINYCSFEKIINYFDEQINFENDFGNLLYKYDKREFIDPCCFEDTTANEYILFLLENIFHDVGHWISYFIYELDFGRDWKPGMVRDTLGNDIKLETIKDVWRLLQENMNDNN